MGRRGHRKGTGRSRSRRCRCAPCKNCLLTSEWWEYSRKPVSNDWYHTASFDSCLSRLELRRGLDGELPLGRHHWYRVDVTLEGQGHLLPFNPLGLHAIYQVFREVRKGLGYWYYSIIEYKSILWNSIRNFPRREGGG